MTNVTRLNFTRGIRDDRVRVRSAIEMDVAEKCAIRGRKGAEMSVFGVTLLPATGTDREINAPQNKYAQWQFSSLYNNLYRLHICDRAYFQCMIIQGPHSRVHFDARPESAAIVSFATRDIDKPLGILFPRNLTLSIFIVFFTTHANPID